jgi:hypothetical protein
MNFSALPFLVAVGGLFKLFVTRPQFVLGSSRLAILEVSLLCSCIWAL